MREDFPSRSSLDSDTGDLKKVRSNVEIRSVSSNSSISPRKPTTSSKKQAGGGCQPDGTCCCTDTVVDEASDPDAIASSAPVCHCNCSQNPATSSSSSNNPSEKAKQQTQLQQLLHPSITLLSGRPHPRNIIRKTLETARGESAVVVCGPRGLIYDARQSVVALSDERAVHRGTGAQGVWFWSEGFGW